MNIHTSEKVSFSLIYLEAIISILDICPLFFQTFGGTKPPYPSKGQWEHLYQLHLLLLQCCSAPRLCRKGKGYPAPMPDTCHTATVCSYSKPRHITAMMEGMKSWLLPHSVPDKPCCSVLYFVQEGEVFAGGATPRKAQEL
ncbi:hypothetical protein E2C01_029582 [Portunus trituberculatus]|uniref:Uncharacterized protein n=1 Tax=Portunus trituberculatus TaxID=210409 RepID=A0A5B7ERU3_PORTR|nr:hypothetical protein [Portunus trituberculatus]